MTLSRDDLTELAGKYAVMLRLRRTGEGDPRAEMAQLATEFPGALRELDDFPLDVLEARRAALASLADGAREHQGAPEPWMVACITFHRLARGALSAKRWLAHEVDRKRMPDEATRADFVEAATTLPFASDALAWEDDLASLARPPRGRISEVVFERVGKVMGISAQEARWLVFGLNRRERRRIHPPSGTFAAGASRSGST